MLGTSTLLRDSICWRAGTALETNLDEIVPLIRQFLSRYERGEAPVLRAKNREK